jgi:hypothetical protein
MLLTLVSAIASAQDKPAPEKPDDTLTAVVGVSAKIQPNARSGAGPGCW